ncbi:MAG: NAD-dependent deacylase [Phycisphaeraceae bacterium]|nr:NAD-dependent deacylase [Phycisphaeraceae bacterium]
MGHSLQPAETDLIRDVGDALATARSVVVMTGAGISAESGIPTFRDSMAGLWKDFDPLTLATPEAFEADPAMVSKWYEWRRLGCLAAEPNPGHAALAELERRLGKDHRAFTLLTQNVDRLHHKAGSRNVVELHGSITVWRCTRTGREVEPGPEEATVFPIRSPFHEAGLLRPGVVWFGEMLPEQALRAADEAVAACDLFMSVGTSAVVYPAAGYLHQARLRGARTVEVNMGATPASGAVDWSIRGASGTVMPALVQRAFAER